MSRCSTLTASTRHSGESADHDEVTTLCPSSVPVPTASSSATLLPDYGSNDPVILSWRSNEPPQPAVGRTTYSFSQLTHRSMLLLPPASSTDSRPLYHIAVETNCFRPASHITVVHRGASEHGVYVGEFECASSPVSAASVGPDASTAHAGSACLRGTTASRWGLSRKCSAGPSSRGTTARCASLPPRRAAHTHSCAQARFEHPRLRWSFDGVALRWDPVFDTLQGRSRMSFRCTRPSPARKKLLRVLATFFPPDPLQALDGVRPMAALTVESEGRQFLDHILITVLLLQQDCYFPT